MYCRCIQCYLYCYVMFDHTSQPMIFNESLAFYCLTVACFRTVKTWCSKMHTARSVISGGEPSAPPPPQGTLFMVSANIYISLEETHHLYTGAGSPGLVMVASITLDKMNAQARTRALGSRAPVSVAVARRQRSWYDVHL